MSTRKRSRTCKSRGYTAVEVLISIAVFGIGAAGVIAMQRASVTGNYDARSLDVANNVMREWQERLRRDATLWLVPSNPPASTTRWLQASAAAPNWTTPPYPVTGVEGLSPAFNIFGQDISGAEATNPLQGATFCTQVRLLALSNTVVQAQVRVSWMRGGGAFVCPTGAFDPTVNPEMRTLTTTNILRGRFGGVGP
jgi:prepilin-type N-terminal cleavage/methylation domain-containing protein